MGENLLKVVTTMVETFPEIVRNARSLPFGLHAFHFAVAGSVQDVKVYAKLLEAFPEAGVTPSKVPVVFSHGCIFTPIINRS